MTEQKRSKLTVEIYNKSYTIIGNESENHVRSVANLVDEKMNEIHEHNSHLDSTKLAVLTAVNTMNDYLKLKEDHAKLLGSIRRKEDQ